MQDIDIIPELPKKSLADLMTEKEALERFAESNCKFLFVDTSKDRNPVIFGVLDTRLYAALVAMFSSSEYSEVFDFFKLALEGARLLKQNTKKGEKGAMRVKKYLERLLSKHGLGFESPPNESSVH